MSPAPGATLATGIVLQGRGVGVLEALQGTFPAWLLDAFAAVTHLGDAAVLLTLAALVYLGVGRRAGAFVLGAVFAGFAVTLAAKAWFALPRPPVELRYVAETGLGFPSGHAVGATVAWGAMALVLEPVWTRRRRAVVAGVVVAAVAVSRVAIGVHYLVDVVVGVLVGLAVLGVAARWTRDEPLGLFGLAGGLAAAAVAVSGASIESVALLGACAGAVTAWQVVDPADRPFGRQGVLASGGGGILLAAGGTVIDLSIGLAFGGAALLTAGVLLVPLARAPGSAA